MKKKRLDVLIAEKGLLNSRQQAKTAVMAGKVFINNQRIDKPGTMVPIDSNIDIRLETIPYVSRGGLKLEKALKTYDININQAICLDVGASTGGFTDCLLQHGAKEVFAVDVGYGQLDWKLRNDPRVHAIERTNIRHMPPNALPCKVDLVTIDVSFISLKIVVPATIQFLKDRASIIALIKPQFEVGKGQVGKGGVVKDPAQHASVIAALSEFFTSLSFSCRRVLASPIKGPKGNQEFLIHLEYVSLNDIKT